MKRGNSRRLSRYEAKRIARGYLFLLPFLLLFFVFTILPILQSFVMSFTNYNMLQPPKFTGLANYQVLFMEDDIFLTALKNTLIFAVIVGPAGYLLSFLFAWVINNLRFTLPLKCCPLKPPICPLPIIRA